MRIKSPLPAMFCIGSIVGALILCVITLVMDFQFSMGCKDYLKRAADANTIKTARVELRTALAYMQVNHLTDGHVSIFLKQPKNDIGFWFNNLMESFKELEAVGEGASQLEKSNVLMKLRETILDETESGTKVTYPDWVSAHPHNGTILFLAIVLVIGGLVSGYFWYQEVRW